MDKTKRNFLAGAAGLAFAGVAGRAQIANAAVEVFTPEMFGAKGDGVTNDSAAFAALSDRVNANSGGLIRLRQRTYLVGAQTRPRAGEDGPAFAPARLLHFERCSKPVTVEGNGAILKCAPGLRFGTFDPATGEPSQHGMPYFQRRELASPYDYMIMATGCTGPVTIADLELDGSLDALRIGGQYGDTGWQIAATGIYLVDNRGDEIVRNVHSHHHPQDGLMINGIDDAALARGVTRRIENVRCEYNGRQGCSMIGGRGYSFRNCAFNHTGRAAIASSPAAGLDIEAEGGKVNRGLTFNNCEFVDNVGCGMVADSGDSADARFNDCRFVGTTNWSAWPKKPRLQFHNCAFVGAIVQAYAAPDARDAVQFHRCSFTDDPAQSPTGKVFLGGGANGPIANLNELGNPIFVGCTFTTKYGGQLPWSIKATYRDCVMVQESTLPAYPRGTYLGRNVITGDVGLEGSNIEGEIILNGRSIPPGTRY